MLNQLQKEIKSHANPHKAVKFQRFFKTGKGEYGEGDVFLGLTVPIQRKIAIKYKALLLSDINILLHSKYHEHRLIALLIIIEQIKKIKDEIIKKYVDYYLDNIKYINNWDLVDLSAHQIIGTYLIDKDKQILHTLSRSENVWKKRIAMLSCFAFIKANKFDDAFKIAETLLHDNHDLIHKAVGWMLREIGKRDQKQEEVFLQKHYTTMPRTMLRYAIERFPEKKRQGYLKGVIITKR